MTPLARRPLRHATLMNGSPRHFGVACVAVCGFTGMRTANCREDIPLGRPCPRCGANVKAVSA